MSRARSTTWVVAALFLAMLMLAGAWYFAIAPRLDSASEMTDQTIAEQARVDQLEIQLAGLERDAANIEQFRAELGTLQTQIPPTLDLASLTRQLDALAVQSGMTVTALNPGVPVEVPPPAAAPVDPAVAPAAEAAEAPAETGTSAESELPATEPVAASPYAGMYQVPLDITVLGGYDATLDLINRLQRENPRLVLVLSFTMTAQDEQAATAGRPAVAAGSIETVVSALAFVLVDPEAGVPADPAVPVEPAPLPVPNGQPNPFSSGGSGS